MILSPLHRGERRSRRSLFTDPLTHALISAGYVPLGLQGIYWVAKGTGKYAGASGSGRYAVFGFFQGCSHHEPPTSFFLVIQASGPLSL